MTELQKALFAAQDPVYRAFSAKLLPTVAPETVIGVRTPRVREIARELEKSPAAAAFLASLPHVYFEENNVHAALINRVKDFDEAVAALDRFLPYVDNWATCDSLSPVCFRKNHGKLRPVVERWLASDRLYTVRFAVKTLMTEFLDGDFDPADPARLAAIRTNEYYLQMAVAWYFATALAKRYETILPWFRPGRLDPTVRKMAVRKARDSFRVTPEQKEELRRLSGENETGGLGLTCVSLASGEEIPLPERTVLCLGNFDGVHLGHRALIRAAKELRDRDYPGAACGVFCFRELSTDLLSKDPPAHLTTPEERAGQFAAAGAEIVLYANFEALRGLSPETFVQTVLQKDCRCVAAVCGFNYRFGKNAAGTAATLRSAFGGRVEVCEAVPYGGAPVSSTRIRAALREGRAEEAAQMLGRPYSVCAEVRHGKALGRKLGFPTVNQNFPPQAVIPAFGVYATACEADGKVWRGVTNVGVHPTVDDPGAPANCETYLVGYRGDLYGKTVRVSFLSFLRPERTFPSVEALREQIARDAEQATKIKNT